MTEPMPAFGIQSWCFRKFPTLPAFFQQLQASGVNRTEVCGVHVDFKKPDTFSQAIREFRDAGVTIQSIGVQMIEGKPEERHYFDFCQQAGVKYMSVTFRPQGMWNAFRHAEKLAEEYDLRLGIHNHGGYDWLGNQTMLQYIFDNTSPRIGLTLDTAWAIDAKQDCLQWVEKFASRLVGVHVKDFTYTPDRQGHDVIIGQGNLDLPRFATALQHAGFNGYTVIEYEADAQNPAPKLKQCVEVLKPLMK